MRIYIWICGRCGWVAGFRLVTLPNMRAADLLALVSGLALHGDVIQYGNGFYRFEARQLRNLRLNERKQLGLSA